MVCKSLAIVLSMDLYEIFSLFFFLRLNLYEIFSYCIDNGSEWEIIRWIEKWTFYLVFKSSKEEKADVIVHNIFKRLTFPCHAVWRVSALIFPRNPQVPISWCWIDSVPCISGQLNSFIFWLTVNALTTTPLWNLYK